MKVLRQGKVDATAEWKYELTCGVCKSLLEIDRDDIFRDKEGIEYIDDYYCQCPVCGKTIYLDKDYIGRRTWTIITEYINKKIIDEAKKRNSWM